MEIRDQTVSFSLQSVWCGLNFSTKSAFKCSTAGARARGTLRLPFCKLCSSNNRLVIFAKFSIPVDVSLRKSDRRKGCPGLFLSFDSPEYGLLFSASACPGVWIRRPDRRAIDSHPNFSRPDGHATPESTSEPHRAPLSPSSSLTRRTQLAERAKRPWGQRRGKGSLGLNPTEQRPPTPFLCALETVWPLCVWRSTYRQRT